MPSDFLLAVCLAICGQIVDLDLSAACPRCHASEPMRGKSLQLAAQTYVSMTDQNISTVLLFVRHLLFSCWLLE